jgi:CO/xanthine dehydrogenase FAD-binding subunit
MPVKEYFRPTSLTEAFRLLTTSEIPAKILAGGTDLLLQIAQDRALEVRLVSLRDIEDLSRISQTSRGEVFIGAMATHAEVAESALLNQLFPALTKASSLVGSPSIRNMGTIGGNICNASPSAETAPPLMAYGAEAVIWSSNGERSVRIDRFFKGPSEQILEPGEVLRGFLLRPRKGLLAEYQKLGNRKAMEIALVNLCVSMVIDEDSRCSQIRIAMGAVAPTPVRARTAERVLRGERITPSHIEKAAEAAVDEARPISDIRGSADYRRKMVGVLLEDILSHLVDLGPSDERGGCCD